MAITWASLDSNTNTTDGRDTQNTGSISPPADSEVWCCFVLGGYTGSGNPTVTSGAGLTLGSWTFVDSMAAGTGRTVYVYRASAGASPGSGVLTIDAEASETWDLITWRVVRCLGHNASDVVEQVCKLAHGNYSGVMETTWDVAMTSGNGALTLVFTTSTGVTWTPRTNWGNLGSRTTTDGTYYGYHGFAGIGETDTYYGGTFTGGAWGSAMGIEINAAPSGPAGQLVTINVNDIE